MALAGWDFTWEEWQENVQKVVPYPHYGNQAYGDRLQSSWFEGASLKAHNLTLVVGATGNPYDENEENLYNLAGAIWIYERPDFETPYTLVGKRTPYGTNARYYNNYFGAGIGVYEDWICVGAPGHEYDASGGDWKDNEPGAAWTYHKVNGVWVQTSKITGEEFSPYGRYEDGTYKPHFGSDVEICRVAGTIWLFVGAPQHGYDENGENYSIRAGVIFIYKINPQTNQPEAHQRLTWYTDRGDQFFGKRFRVSEDGWLIAGNNYANSSTGVCEMFKYNEDDVSALSYLESWAIMYQRRYTTLPLNQQ